MLEVISISFAFIFGLAVRQIGLPPLIGYLAAGFALSAYGPAIGLPQETRPILDHVAHLGVLLLLFAVGLKLKLGQITQPQVLGGALGHSALTTALLGPVLALAVGLDWSDALLLAVSLSFSSTVFAAKALEAKRDLGTFYGRTAIGVLIMQDLIALVVLAVWGGQTPSPWALLLLAIPLVRPLLHRLLDLAGHDELMVLAGLVGALAAMRDRPDSTDLLPALQGLPTLVVVGAEDAITPPAAAEAMAKAIPGARLAVIPEAGHLSPLEQPEAFNRHLELFLQGLAEASGTGG